MKSVSNVASHVRAILGISAIVAVGLTAVTTAANAQEASTQEPLRLAARDDDTLDTVTITAARRREEAAQEVPIPIAVIDGKLLEDTGAFNVSRLHNIVPTVQFFSSNPRNTSVNIRGLGQPYGLTNDGIESGVGFYVDGVLYARPASTTLDFIDVERVEVLRGPQGTLFGKNTTAGAILVTTRKPEFDAGIDFELSYGNYGYTQAKGSITGPLSESVAARLSFSGTQRDGTLFNTVSQIPHNDLNNTGVRGQLLFLPTENVDINLAVDYSRQRPVGYAQVLAGVTPTYRGTPGYASSLYGIPANPSANPRRHFWGIVTDLGYWPANVDPVTREVDAHSRLIDTNTTWRSGNENGGASLNIDADIGGGTLTSTTAWRFWDWDPSNDRDYLGLDVGTLSQAPSKHEQWTQEVRWAGDLTSNLSAVFGLYGFSQKLKSNPVHTESVGEDYWRFVWNPSPTGNGYFNPALYGPGGSVVDNYYAGQRSEITSQLDTVSAAFFTQIDWEITERFSVLPGLRYNYDKKEVDFQQRALNIPNISAGPTPRPAAAYSNQTAIREDDDTNLSGNLTLAFDATDNVNVYATYSTAFKSIGINLGGGPAIEVPPEDVQHYEIGVKTSPLPGVTLNATAYNTDIDDFQTQVLVPGNARPVIASAEKVRVRGVELDANAQVSDAFSVYAALAYTDGKYVSFANAPVPLELTGYTAPSGLPQVNASGGRLPGISEWSGSLGGEYRAKVSFLGKEGEVFTGVDVFYRDEFSSSATPSEFLNIDGYALTNVRFGFRATDGWSTYLWVRNALDEEYFELLQAAPAGQGVGHYGAQLGDPRTFGVTLRHSF